MNVTLSCWRLSFSGSWINSQTSHLIPSLCRFHRNFNNPSVSIHFHCRRNEALSLFFFPSSLLPPSPFLNLDVFIHHCLSARPPALLSLRWIHQLHWCQSQAALPGTGWLACPPRPLTSFIVYSLHFLSFPARFFDNNHVFWRDQSQCCFSTFRWKTSVCCC